MILTVEQAIKRTGDHKMGGYKLLNDYLLSTANYQPVKYLCNLLACAVNLPASNLQHQRDNSMTIDKNKNKNNLSNHPPTSLCPITHTR